MPQALQDHIGRRLRVARIAAGLTQHEFAGLMGRSSHWVEDAEAGRLPVDRLSVLSRAASICDVDLVWLLGQPYRLAGEIGNADAHSHVPAIRSALRRATLVLSGHPGLSPAATPVAVTDLASRAHDANRTRQSADLAGCARLLPALLEDLTTSLMVHDAGPANEATMRSLLSAARTGRQTLNLLGYPDLAWVASEVAAGAATALDDPIAKAEVAWDRCGAMLHHGSLRETEIIAAAALKDLEPHVGHSQSAVALSGALVLRQVIAMARAGRTGEAWSLTATALEYAERLPESFHDVDRQTVFGRANVAVHATEVGVEIEEPGKGLTFVDGVDAASVPSKERVTHHEIDKARALRQMNKNGEAVTTLRAAAAKAPHYVCAHPMARALVDDLVRVGVPSQAAALSSLVRRMQLVA